MILLLGGCYSYQSVSSGAKLAQENYEGPIFVPPYPVYPQICIQTGIVIVTETKITEQPQRSEHIKDIRNGGEGRILDIRERRR